MNHSANKEENTPRPKHYGARPKKIGSEQIGVKSPRCKGFADVSVTFFGEGRARTRAEVFVQQKTEQSVLCSDVEATNGDPPEGGKVPRRLPAKNFLVNIGSM